MKGALLLVGFLSIAIVAEALLGRRLGARLYEWRDSERSLGLAVGWAFAGIAMTAAAGAAEAFAYQHRLLDMGNAPAAWIAAFLLADLLYYVWHRLSHVLPWMWASHFPHHTAKRINMLASVRQGWTDLLSGAWLTWVPLGFLGFSPAEVAPYLMALFLVQMFAHNEWTPRLGPLEWVLVTPSNHRLHHSLEAAHVDRNFGGVLVVWDRLFGTYVAEAPQILHRFGVAGYDADQASPVDIALHAWRPVLQRIVRRLAVP